jgi:large subunit ribosomal protein L18
MAVFRSNQHIYVQVIDDVAQATIVSASTVDPELKEKVESGANCAAAAEVGKLVAQRAIAKGIKQVVFDRGGNLYHGRVQILADAAREAGLEF